MQGSGTAARRIGRRSALVATVTTLLVVIGTGKVLSEWRATAQWPDAEFHMVRMSYDTQRCAGSRGWCNPMWAVDYPEAEANFLPALRRMTNLSVAADSIHLPLSDDRIFDYPWVFLQQPAAGRWFPSNSEAERLREYLMRGGFLVVDDFHGPQEFAWLQDVMQRVLPGRPIVDIPHDDPLMSLFYDLDPTIQIPGERHVRWGGRMQGPPNWRGIRDDSGRFMVVINHNADMGDAWEHADDPYYPAEMTATAYRFGVNYVIYAMTR
jgi:hypothetical protein